MQQDAVSSSDGDVSVGTFLRAYLGAVLPCDTSDQSRIEPGVLTFQNFQTVSKNELSMIPDSEFKNILKNIRVDLSESEAAILTEVISCHIYRISRIFSTKSSGTQAARLVYCYPSKDSRCFSMGHVVSIASMGVLTDRRMFDTLGSIFATSVLQNQSFAFEDFNVLVNSTTFDALDVQLLWKFGVRRSEHSRITVVRNSR